MVYVPKCSADVFVSYAHADDAVASADGRAVPWVEALVAELEREVRKRLGGGAGSQATIWRDTDNIRLGDNWPAALDEAVTGAAIFLAIVSPNYMSSRVCSHERTTFLRVFDSEAAAALGLLLKSRRFLKLIRLPLENDEHLKLLPEVQHLLFYQRDRQGNASELLSTSDEFRKTVLECATAIKDILQGLRRQREKLFVAWPAPDCEKAWDRVWTEFKNQGYNVQPDGPLDPFIGDEQIQDRMKEAKVSIHLLGAQYDGVAERQIRLAAAMNLRLFFWLTKEGAATTDERQRALRERIEAGQLGEGADLPEGWSLLRSSSLSALCEDIRAALKPQAPAAAPPRPPNGSASVYLLCDPTTDEDAAFARRLGDEVREREGIPVFLPPSNPSERKERHRGYLQQCDGVLLYSEAAPRDWLRFAVEDVTHAETSVPRPPLRSKALLTPDPAPWRSYPIRLIPRKPQFSLDDLEPFLAPLRQARPAGARP